MNRADLRYSGRFSQRAPSKGARLRVRTHRDFVPFLKWSAAAIAAVCILSHYC